MNKKLPSRADVSLPRDGKKTSRKSRGETTVDRPTNQSLLYSGKPAVLPADGWEFALAFSLDGHTLAVGGNGCITLWRMSPLARQGILKCQKSERTTAVAFLREGQILAATYDESREIQLHDLATGRVVKRLDCYVKTPKALTYHPASNRLVAGPDWGGEVLFWQLPDGANTNRIRVYPSRALSHFNALAISHDGQLLAVCRKEDDDIRIWNVDSGERLFTLSGHTDEVRDIAFSVQGDLLASCSEDHTVRVWEMPSGRSRATLVGHDQGVNCVTFLPNGNLLSAGRDRTVRIWDVAIGRQVRLLEHDQEIKAVALSPSGQMLATSGASCGIALWDLSSEFNDLNDVLEVTDSLVSTGAPTAPDTASTAMVVPEETDVTVDSGVKQFDDEQEDEETDQLFSQGSQGRASDSEVPTRRGSEWPLATEGDVCWRDLIAVCGAPVEGSIPTDEEWKAAKREGRIATIFHTDKGKPYYARIGLYRGRIMCRAVFSRPIPRGVVIRNVNLDEIDWDFSTAVVNAESATQQLMTAIAAGDVKVAAKAIEAGADIDCEGADDPPLLLAVKAGNLELVELLVASGANISYQDRGEQAWRLAVLNGHTEIARFLADKGVEAKPTRPLIQAIYEGHLAAVKRIMPLVSDLRAGDVFVRPYILRGTPLALAASAGSREVVELLVRNGADVNGRDDEGVTPWIAAAASGHEEVLVFLASHGAKANPRDALLRAAQLGMAEAIGDLVERGADPNAVVRTPNGRTTPLEAAITSSEFWVNDSNARVVIALHPHSQEVSEIHSQRRSQVVEKLLNQGADPNTCTAAGRPLLFVAVDLMRDEVIPLLLNHGALPDPRDGKTGDTPLLLASKASKTTCAKLMLKGGADPNARDRRGMTPLLGVLTAFQPSAELVFALCAYGAELNVMRPKGKTLLDLAKRIIRKNDDQYSVEQCKQIVEFLTNNEIIGEYAGALARKPETAEDFFLRANCALTLLRDTTLAVEELVNAVSSDSTSIDRIIKGLTHAESDFRQCAAIALGRLGSQAKPAIPRLIATLEDCDSDVVDSVFGALIAIGPEALPDLGAALTENTVVVAKFAAMAIVSIDGSLASQVLEPLRRRLPAANGESLQGPDAFLAAVVHQALSFIYHVMNDHGNAIVEAEKATRLDPTLENGTFTILAGLKADLGDDSLSRAIDCYSAGREAASEGNYPEAIARYKEAIAITPSFPWGYNNLAWLCATCSDASFRNSDVAIANAIKACELTGWRYFAMLDTLAAAYALAKKFDEAQKLAEKALAVAPPESQDEYKSTLGRYRAGLPWAAYAASGEGAKKEDRE